MPSYAPRSQRLAMAFWFHICAFIAPPATMPARRRCPPPALPPPAAARPPPARPPSLISPARLIISPPRCHMVPAPYALLHRVHQETAAIFAREIAALSTAHSAKSTNQNPDEAARRRVNDFIDVADAMRRVRRAAEKRPHALPYARF